MAEEIQSEVRRDEKGRLLPGSKLPGAGRPEGSVSAMTEVRNWIRANPSEWKKWVGEYIKDPSNRKHVVEMLDGKPRQAMEHSGEMSLPYVISVEKYGETDEDDKSGDGGDGSEERKA